MRSPAKHLAALATGAVVLAAACTSAPASDNVLRIAMGSPGEAQIRVWDDVAKQFEAANPGMKVELNYQDDDLYQTIGLQNLLNGRNAPDIYFEWTGNRLAQRVKDGFAADISSKFDSGPLAGLFDDTTLDEYKIDDKIVMVPYSADVTNVLWFNKELLSKAAVFMARAKITRVFIGPLAGNPFPDATDRFFETFAQALSIGLASPIEIEAPFASLHKADVIRLGRELHVPLDLTLSCMQPDAGRHCGRCSKCRERRDAFIESGVEDPTTYAVRPER